MWAPSICWAARSPEDVAGYFVESEQIPTACALGVLVEWDQSVKAAGGYLIQLMPGAGEDVITKVEGGIMAAGPVSALLDKNDDPEQLLRDVMSDFDLKILETCPVSYKCYCSREQVERALISLGRDELEQMLSEQGGCQLTCQFCDAVYDFSVSEISASDRSFSIRSLNPTIMDMIQEISAKLTAASAQMKISVKYVRNFIHRMSK